MLIVDDELTSRHALQRVLHSGGCAVEVRESAEAALSLVAETRPAAVLLDIVLPGMNGLEALSQIKKLSPDTEVVIMTSHASVETAIQAIREGAYDYLQKPFDDVDEVWITVQRALEKCQLARKNRSLVEETWQQNLELGCAVARLSSLVEASRVMSESGSPRELFTFFVEFLAKQLEVDRISLMLLDRDGRQLTIAAQRGLDNVDPAAVRVEIGEGIAGTVARSGEPFLVSSASDDERLSGRQRQHLAAESFVSAPIVLSVPLRSSKKVIGVVNLTDRRDGRLFDDDDLNYVLALSSHLAVSIEKLRHVEDLDRTCLALKTTRDQLVLAERLRAVGQAAAGVAHDFNNLLSVVSGRAELAKMKLAGPHVDLAAARSDLEAIGRVAIQGAKVFERMQSFTRTGRPTAAENFALNDAVRNAVEMMRSIWKDRCEIDGCATQIECDLKQVAKIRGNVHEITQALSDLIFNVVEAMPEGGTLRVRTLQQAEWVVAQVEDTGIGMDETTRARMGGLGLGTSVAHEIVTSHKGEIIVESVRGRGTLVTLRFPAITSPTEPTSSQVCADIGERRQAQVLLVDDDEQVRATYLEALKFAGHRVRDCSSGKEALELLASQGFDVLVTDIGMRGMSGLDLVRRIREQGQSLPVVVVSGWGGDKVDAKAREAGVDYVLRKPCLIERLLESVHEAVAGAAAAGRRGGAE